MSQTTREIASTLAKLRTLLQDARKDLLSIRNNQQALQATLSDLWTTEDVDAIRQSAVEWKELVGLVASGRIVALSAQADDALSQRGGWVSSGASYVRWLADGVSGMLARCPKMDSETEEQGWEGRSVAALCSRALGFGYVGMLCAGVPTWMARAC